MTKRVILDVEADSLNPTLIWCIVVEDCDTGKQKSFTRPDLDPERFLKYAETVDLWIAHNGIWYDFFYLNKLLKATIFTPENTLDTLILSQLENFQRPNGHSLENWGELLQFPKNEYNDFSRFTFEMLDYCRQDVALTRRVFDKLEAQLLPHYQRAVQLEHQVAWILRGAHENGFAFNASEAREIQKEIQLQLASLDTEIQGAFPIKSVVTKSIFIKGTKEGLASKASLRWYDGDIRQVSPNTELCRLTYEEFNPGSPKQVVERLHEAGWQPTEKTKTHLKWERYRPRTPEESRKKKEKLEHFRKYGWKVSENNLATLPETAPEGAKLLVKRLFYASRDRTLTEWFENYDETRGRIFGTINGLGTWTHRCSHRAPNTGNIATEKSLKYAGKEMSELAKHYGKRMRSLWCAPRGRVLVGTDAEGIQLRILAHYLENQEYVEAICRGRKEDLTDIHSVNRRALGEICRTRDDAKTFIYAFLLGAGIPKLASILKCSIKEASDAKERFIQSIEGLQRLREETIPRDASRGYFIGLDGRPVLCDSEHHMLAGYLQNGETVCVKLWMQMVNAEIQQKKLDAFLVNVVHDEILFDSAEDCAEAVKEISVRLLPEVGKILKVKCPLSAEGKIGKTWYEVH